MTSTDTLKRKRQYFHQILVALGEEAYKEVIVSAMFGTESTLELTEKQLDKLIADAKTRLNSNRKPVTDDKAEITIKKWRNKCLLVLNERGIMANPKDWTAVNAELAKKQYQWVLTDEQRAKGIENHKGLYAFTTVDSLKKLFQQLAAIRDNEIKHNNKLKAIMHQN